MDVKILPGTLSGTLEAIPSKSELHRMLICAAFADNPTGILFAPSAYTDEAALPNDIRATISCLRALGAAFIVSPGRIAVTPADPHKKADSPLLDCGESGSTLRFLLPVAAAVSEEPSFTGGGRLPERPIGELANALKNHGIRFSADKLPFTCSGVLSGGVFEIPGDISSQYLTGLLLALPLLPESGTIRLTTALRSSAYIDITEQVMSDFGIRIERSGNEFRTTGANRCHTPGTIRAGGDWSNMAAFLAASAMRKGNRIQCLGLRNDSCQGDKHVLDLLRGFGAGVHLTEDTITTEWQPLSGTSIDIDETPDLLPVLAAAGCAAEGETLFFNAGRLRLKESDRIESTARMIRSLGGTVRTTADSLVIEGNGSLKGGEVDAENDHRIVMAAAAASVICEEPVIIHGAEAVNKSYPGFWNDFRSLKGVCHVL